MSTSNNPFAQGGWLNAGSAPSTGGSWDHGSSPPPSIFGALPYPSSASVTTSTGSIIVFTFTEFSPTILNCSVVDNRSNTVFRVSTETTPRYTFIKDRDGVNVAIIEWQTRPSVEIRGAVAKQEARNWLPLSSDGRSRFMTKGNTSYVWAPDGNSIFLYSSTAQILAKISKTTHTVILELNHSALEQGLLDCCVVATLLLQSGRNID